MDTELTTVEVGEHYLVEDQILPILHLPNPCEVRITITDKYVSLNVGQRDWQWTRGCPEVNSCGTMFDGGADFNPDSLPNEIPEQ